MATWLTVPINKAQDYIREKIADGTTYLERVPRTDGRRKGPTFNNDTYNYQMDSWYNSIVVMLKQYFTNEALAQDFIETAKLRPNPNFPDDPFSGRFRQLQDGTIFLKLLYDNLHLYVNAIDSYAKDVEKTTAVTSRLPATPSPPLLRPTVSTDTRTGVKTEPDKSGKLADNSGRGVGGRVHADGGRKSLTVKEDKSSSPKPKIFVVHGHDTNVRKDVELLLRQLEVTPITLYQEPSGGRTIIEKIEAYAGVDYAVVLLTPDDVGSLKSDSEHPKPRARQNVVFELGYFMALLGRARVCALLTDHNIERPSDVSGVVYIEVDKPAWQYSLAQEMNAVGISVDVNKIKL